MKENLNHTLSRATLRQLRALVAILRTGSTKAAAAALHVTPPAITLQLRDLEAMAGAPLIERRPNGVQPTAIGAELLAAAEKMEATLAETAEAIEAIKGLRRGTVSVGVIDTAQYFAPMALAAFVRDHPEIEMRLSIGNRKATIQALTDFEFDFAIMGRPPQDLKVDHAEIGEHPHVIIVPPDHPLAGKQRMPLSDLADQTFLLREHGSGTRTIIDHLFLNAGLNLKAGMEIASNETIKQAVIAGIGIALLSAHTVAAEIADGRLKTLDVEGLPILRTWYLVKRSDKRLLPAAGAMWTFLSAHARDFLPSLP